LRLKLCYRELTETGQSVRIGKFQDDLMLSIVEAVVSRCEFCAILLFRLTQQWNSC